MGTYDDQALLFITSTDGRIPQGRNARAQHRANAARQAVFASRGEFHTLDLSSTHEGGEHQTEKVRKRAGPEEPLSRFVGAPAKWRKIRQNAPRSLQPGWTLPYINPGEVLLVATFHVRRMTATSISSSTTGLAETLRRRQWSCLPYAGNCFGKDACVDSAVLCVADRIRFLSGAPFCPAAMMKHYENALRDLQTALYEPQQHNPQDILVAVQLLAVYEMLDSLDNDAWSKHAAGAATLIQKYTVITPEQLEKWQSRGCGHALPLFSDALISGDTRFFETYSWRELLGTIFSTMPNPPEGILDLMQCLRLLPNLLLDTAAACSRIDEGSGDDVRFALLDRAYDLRHRMRSAMRGNQLYTSCNYRDMLSTHDLLGTFLAGLLALDRIVATLTPASMSQLKLKGDDTNELCAQLLQLELGASVHYPPAEVLAGFQSAGSTHTWTTSPISIES